MNGARPAGFWIRVVAALIDLAVFTVVRASLAVVGRRLWGTGAEDSTGLHAAVALFTIAFAICYLTVLHSATGQTIGKLLVHARVVLVDGGRVPVGTSLLRCLAYALSGAPLGLGFVMAGLRHDKRALHDLVAGTRVDRELRPVPGPPPSAPPAE